MAVRGKAFDRSPPSKILRLPREGGKRVFISRHRGGEKLTTPFPLGLVHSPRLALEGTFSSRIPRKRSHLSSIFILRLLPRERAKRWPRQPRLRVRRSGRRDVFSKERGQRETSGRSSSARNDAVTVVGATGLEFLVDLFRSRARPAAGRWRQRTFSSINHIISVRRFCHKLALVPMIRRPWISGIPPRSLELWLRGMRFLSTLFYRGPEMAHWFDFDSKRSDSKLWIIIIFVL